MGLAATIAARRWPLPPELWLMLTTVFLGSYTTFSSYELETALMGDRFGLIYWLGSPLLGMVGMLAGMALAEAAIADGGN